MTGIKEKQIPLIWEQLQGSSVLTGILKVRWRKCTKNIVSMAEVMEGYIFIKPSCQEVKL